MADLTMRRATVADLAPVHALVERAYRGDSAKRGWTHEADLLGGQRTDPQALAAIMADARQRLLVASEGSAIIGCVAITNQGGGAVYLGLLTVDPERQAGGLGRQLLEAAEAEAAAVFNADRIEMTVFVQRPELIAWYKRRGYRDTGERRAFDPQGGRLGVVLKDELNFAVLSRPLASPSLN